MFDPKVSPKTAPVKGLIFWQFPDCLNIDKFRDSFFNVSQIPAGVLQEFLGGDVPLGPLNPQPRVSMGWWLLWLSAKILPLLRLSVNPIETLLAYTRASSAEFSCPIYTKINSPNPPSLYPRVAVFQKLLTEVTSTVQPKQAKTKPI